MIPYLNIDKMNEIPKLWLCKPDLKRTTIARLTDIHNFKLNTKENTLNEITFDVPLMVERNHELIDNHILDKFKGLYYVKMVKDGRVEYFVSSKHSGALSNDGLSKSYQLFSLGHQLDNKTIRGYEGVSQNLSKYVLDFLVGTNWSIGSVDVDFDLKYRSFEVSSATVLQCLYDVAELFGAYIEWDTINRRISFYDPNKVGLNRGLRFKQGHYLESFDVEFDYDEIITRLRVYGEDGLEFRRLSPTGMNYIEDFTWFMYPFECDGNYNVIRSSYYMSDDLCIALTKYNKLLEQKDGEFKNLVDQRTNKEDEIQQREQELSVLTTEIRTYYNELDVINATYGDSAKNRDDYNDCIARINNKKTQIQSKESEINSLETQLSNIESQINSLRETLRTENNFTTQQIAELNDFIIEKEYTNESIVDEQDLLDEGMRVFKEMSVPKITLSMNVANFLNVLENDPNRKKLILGDTVRFKSEKLKTELSARLSEINYDFENDSISVVVTNTRNVKSEDEKLFELINGSVKATTTVNMDKFKWNQAYSVSDDVSKLLASTFDATLNGIKAGTNGSTILNERGLYSTTVDDPNTMLVVSNGVFGISGDGLQSLNVAINKDGVWADKLHGRILIGNKLHIETETGIINLEGSTETIFDNTGKKRVELGRYVLDGATKYGLNIIEGSIDIRTSATSNRGVQLDSNGFRAFNNNGVKTFDINSVTGEVSIVGSMNIKTSSSTNRGVVFDGNGISAYNSSGTRTFYVDTNGNFTANTGTFTGIMNATGGTISGNLNVTGTLTGGTVKGAKIDGGIIEGSYIETSKNIYVGDSIFLGSSDSVNKGIYFGSSTNGGSISYLGNDRSLRFYDFGKVYMLTTLELGSSLVVSGNVYFNSDSTIYFTGANVEGLYVDYAYESSRLDGYRHSDFVKIGSGASGLELAYSSASRRIYFRRNGSDIGWIDFDDKEIGV